MSNEKKDKLDKRLNDFVKKNTSPKKKWKSLLSFAEGATEEAQKIYFEKNFFLVFAALEDILLNYEAGFKKGKSDPQKDLGGIIMIFKKIMIYMEGLIKKGWQTAKLTRLIERFLYKDNKHETRLRGIEVLLLFIDALHPGDAQKYKEQWSLLAQSVDLSIFSEQPMNLKFKLIEAPPKSIIYDQCDNKSKDKKTLIKETLEILKIIFEFTIDRPDDKFSYWLEVIKFNFLTTLYSEVCKSMSLIPKEEEGFISCPPELQYLLIEYLAKWNESPKKIQAIWESPQNAQLMLEIFTQCVGLSTKYTKATEISITTFHNLFMVEKVEPSIEGRIQAYRKYFLNRLASVFVKEPEGSVQEHMRLCVTALDLIKKTAKLFDKLDQPSKDTILIIPLNVLKDLFTQKQHFEMAKGLAAPLIHATIWIWINANQPTKWNPIQNVISYTLGKSTDSINAACDKLFQITLVIRKLFYSQHEKFVSKRKEGAVHKSFSISPDFEEQKEPPKTDQEIYDLPWTEELALSTWNSVLQIFAKLNQISDAKKHFVCVSNIISVIDYLIAAENEIPYSSLIDVNKPKPVSLIDTFGPWLIEATGLPETYMEGKAAAYGALCRIICRRADPLPITLLTYFYGIIVKPLEEFPVSPIGFEIIKSTSNIFNLFFQGVNCLIPYYLHAIKQLINSDQSALPTKVRHNCITILCSLLCFPNYFGKLTIPIKFKFPFKIENPENISFLEIKDILVSVLREMLTQEDSVEEHKMMIISGLCVFILEELSNSLNPSLSLLTDCINDILTHTKSSIEHVSKAALDVISTLSSCYPLWAKLGGESVVEKIITYLCNSVIDYELNSTFEFRTDQHFEVLTDYLLACPPALMDDPKLRKTIFTAIEVGLLGEKLEGKDTSENKTDLFQRLLAKPTHNSPRIQQSAEKFLLLLLNAHDQFPSPSGIPATTSTMNELSDTNEEERDVIYWKGNGDNLVSLVPLQNGNEQITRIFVRNKTGTFSWEAQPQYDDFSEKLQLPIKHNTEETTKNIVTNQKKSSETSQWTPQLPPLWKDDGRYIDEDRVDQLLKHLSFTHEDCQTSSVSELKEKSSIEQCNYVLQSLDKQSLVTCENKDNKTVHASLPLPEVPINNYHFCRLFLSHLSYCDYDHRDIYKLYERSKSVTRTITSRLEEKFDRYTAKIGVAYVKKGQDKIIEMLENDKRSQNYDVFIKSLGYEVSFQEGFPGFDGRLTSKNGLISPYYATGNLELMFHDLTCMPTIPNDNQQVDKKRHIGNDVVNIIFSEHVRDYDPCTQSFSSHYCMAHVIVYPLTTGLYRIQICRKHEQVPILPGPLLHGMVISKSIMPLLVRSTAIIADRIWLAAQPTGVGDPFADRDGIFKEMGKKQVDNTDFSESILASFEGRNGEVRKVKDSVELSKKSISNPEMEKEDSINKNIDKKDTKIKKNKNQKN